MADPNEEQLDLTLKINAAVERLSRNLDKISQTYETQVTTVEKLSKAMDHVSTRDSIKEMSELTASVGALNESLKNAQKKTETTSERITKATSKMSKGFGSLEKKATVAGFAIAG